MPMYCYSNDKGDTLRRWFPASHRPKKIRHNGATYFRDYAAEAVGVPASAGWPMTCYASGVAPSQAQELRDFYLKNGVPTEVTADGDPIYRSAAHRRRALKVRGMHDKSSFL